MYYKEMEIKTTDPPYQREEETFRVGVWPLPSAARLQSILARVVMSIALIDLRMWRVSVKVAMFKSRSMQKTGFQEILLY